MAVTLPSDLVLDVMRNADPNRRSAAVARLSASGPSFTDVVETTGSGAMPGAASGLDTSQHTLRNRGSEVNQRKADAYQGFERLVLRNLFETMLPDEASGTFGSGPSAGIWRSMAADQLAGVYAQSGGIGVAEMLSSSAKSTVPQREPQWPYFELQPIKAFTG